MINFLRSHGRVIALSLAVVMVISILAVSTDGFGFGRAKTSDNFTSDDQRVAGEISNMTGVPVEKVLSLRSEGRDWNEVLEELKETNSQGGNDANSRDNLLSQIGAGDELVGKLKEEGFVEDEIMEAKLLAERVLFQLQEISREDGLQAAVPKVDIGLDKEEEEDTEAYLALAEKFDLKACLYLSLKLKKDFGSVEKAMDEYLYSLQLGINLEQYMINKEAYLKQKEEKSLGYDTSKIITITKLEEKMLSKIQEDNLNNKNQGLPELKTEPSVGSGTASDIAPELPLPEFEDIRPRNPAEEIMNEIHAIDPMKN